MLKKFLLPLILSCIFQTSHARVDDGIYVIPDINAYALILSQGNLAKFYIFWLDGRWTTGDGSRVGDVIKLAQVTDKDVAAVEMAPGPLGATIEQLYCNPYPEGSTQGCDDDPDGRQAAIPVLKANGMLKAIYQTQWGADVVVFENDEIGVLLLFEYGSSTSDPAWLGAYTAAIDKDLQISDLEVVVESDASDDERKWFGGLPSVTTRFTVQIDNSIDQQASFTNFSCKIEGNESAADLCEQMKEKYFSTLIRKF
jgi:hypothetical protein